MKHWKVTVKKPPQLSERQRFSHWRMHVCHANTGEIKTRQNEVPKMNFFSLCRMCLCVFVNGCRSAKGCFRQERRNFVEFLSNNKKKVVGACLDLLICICSYKFVPPGVVFFFFVNSFMWNCESSPHLFFKRRFLCNSPVFIVSFFESDSKIWGPLSPQSVSWCLCCSL